MNTRTVIIAATACVMLPTTGYGQEAPAEVVRATVEATRELPPERDALSAARRQGKATLALVARLVITGDEARLEDVQLLHLAYAPRGTSEGERMIMANALNATRELVGVVSVTDPRISVAEGIGIVVRDSRAVSLAIPLKGRPASLEVTVPGFDPGALPLRFDLEDRMDELCRQFPGADIC